MMVTPLGMVTDLSALQPLKSWGAMAVMPLGSAMAVMLLQSSKASLAICFTLAGMVMAERLSQVWKASLPIAVSEDGSTIFVRLLAPAKMPAGSSPAWVLRPPLTLLSTMVAPERSRAVTRHSPGLFLLVLVRVTICWSSLRSAPSIGPLIVRSAIWKRWSSAILVANWPAASSLTVRLF